MGLSIWEKETFYAPQDIIIAGSGFTGLWAAYYLKKKNPSLKILVVERGITPMGASTRNAGFACFGSVTELISDIRTMGQDNMLQLVEMRYEGLKRIRKTFSKSKIDWERNGGFELIGPNQYSNSKLLKNDIGLLNILLRKLIGQDKTFRLADKKIKEFGFKNIDHLIFNPSEAQLQPAKLLHELLQKIISMGVTVMHNVSVTGFEKTQGRIELHSNLPANLCADQFLVATNAFAKQLLPSLDIEYARGQVLVTAPIKKIAFKGTFHFDEGYYYFRNLGNRILLGGARNMSFDTEKTDSFETTEIIQQELERFLHDSIMPGKPIAIEHRWSGIMGMGKEKTPIIKKIKSNIFCAVRMSGMGVALAPVVGEKVAKMMRE
jgi:gamma-glutamylputrescine oxidase